MPTLILKFKEIVLVKYHFKKQKTITIGRKEDNDIFIENLAISGYHAKIDALGSDFLITDLQSKNGSFVNGKKITSNYLKDGDIITIGRHTITFDNKKNEEDSDDSNDAMNETMILDTAQHKLMMATNADYDAKKTDEKVSVGTLMFLSGQEGEFKLSKKMIKIGKDSQSDIVVGGFMMGKIACTISKRPNGYYLSYVGGRIKPKVNGESVSGSIKLKELDTIEIGKLQAQFFDKG